MRKSTRYNCEINVLLQFPHIFEKYVHVRRVKIVVCQRCIKTFNLAYIGNNFTSYYIYITVFI